MIEYLFGDDLVFADIIPLPSEAKHLVRGVPIRVTTSVHHENGVHDTVVDELPGVQAELTVDATRAPHIEDVVWNRERRRAFTYQLSKPADALVACEIWREFSWCVFADAEDALVMPLLPLELKPRGEPQIGFTAFDMSGDRVIASSSYASEAWIGYSAPLPIRIVAP